jgi:hypothetical protein
VVHIEVKPEHLLPLQPGLVAPEQGEQEPRHETRGKLHPFITISFFLFKMKDFK